MREYKCLNTNKFENGDFKLIPIRDEDKLTIMKMRNEQIYHLRQAEPLTVEMQEAYFENVVSKLFEQEKPNQILFSLLENDEFVGYGGLVHINWIDKNAEISFVMKTELEKDKFSYYWENYLFLLEEMAFKSLNFHKVFTYAFDLRPQLYSALEKMGFNKEARLKEHCFFGGKFIDVVIHSKMNENDIKFREASVEDVDLLFNWANDDDVRQNAINTAKILLDDHENWFNNKLVSNNTKIYIFYEKNNHIVQIRLDKSEDFWFIDYSVDKSFRGKGFGSKMLGVVLDRFKGDKFKAIVKKTNVASQKVFDKFGFKLIEETYIEDHIVNVFEKFN